MYRRCCLSTVTIATVCAFAGIGQTAEKIQGRSDAAARKVFNFVLPDQDGHEHALADWSEKKAVVLFFTSSECPIANRYLPVLMDLQKKYDGQQVQILLVYPNHSDTLDKIKAHVEQFKITLPVLQDLEQQVALATGAKRTAETVLLDWRRAVRYEGRVDDRYGYEHQRGEPTRRDLEEAVDEVLAHKPVSVAQTATAGCRIAFRNSKSADGEITYHKQVARIVQDKCQNCHRPGSAGPFALLTPEDAMNWSDTIKEVVLERRMPPWHADQRYGRFSNDRSLSQNDIDTLVKWVDTGMPLGNTCDSPPPREFTEGWTIGKPDVVFELPEEVTVPAQGVVPYQYYETATNFKEDVWIEAAEARPGNRAAVHHIIVFFKDGPSSPRRVGEPITGTAPGDMALVLPPGVGRRIPAGATLIFQMHYTPTGKEEKDRSQVGLVFYKGKEPPKFNAVMHGIGNQRFEIPPGEPHYKVESSFTVPQDTVLLSFMPHMHLRGKDFLYTAEYPDGRQETLLSVPRYDFGWQSAYRLAAPLPVPKGTKLHCVAHFDNSTDNPANPDPTKTIRFGEQTWDEMMFGYVDFTTAAPAASVSGQKKAAAPQVPATPGAIP